MPWEVFKPTLEQVHEKPRKSKAGRKPIDVIVMFKLLVLQQMYNISDDELEYQVNDRLLNVKGVRRQNDRGCRVNCHLAETNHLQVETVSPRRQEAI